MKKNPNTKKDVTLCVFDFAKGQEYGPGYSAEDRAQWTKNRTRKKEPLTEKIEMAGQRAGTTEPGLPSRENER